MPRKQLMAREDSAGNCSASGPRELLSPDVSISGESVIRRGTILVERDRGLQERCANEQCCGGPADTYRVAKQELLPLPVAIQSLFGSSPICNAQSGSTPHLVASNLFSHRTSGL